MQGRRLTITFEGHAIGTLDLEVGIHTFGRDGAGVSPNYAFEVKDDFLSPQHCHFVVEPDYMEVVDGWPDGRSASTFGVHVNGIRVNRFEVEAGDVIRLGEANNPSRCLEITVGTSVDGEVPTPPPPRREAPPPSAPPPPVPDEAQETVALTNDEIQRLQQPVVAEAGIETEYSTREADVEVLRGAPEAFYAEAGIPLDKAAFKGRHFRLHTHQQELLIGRDLGCDVIVHDPDPAVNRRVSRHHSRVEYRPEEGQFRLFNRSGNGTLVKRRSSPVMDDAVLDDGDVIVVGRTELKIRITGFDQAAGTAKLSSTVVILGAAGAGLALLGLLILAATVFANRLLPSAKPAPRLLWSAEVGNRGRVMVGAGREVIGGRPALLATTARGKLAILDGSAAGAVLLETTQGSAIFAAPAVGDVDGDGADDLVVASGDGEAAGTVARYLGAADPLWEESPGCLGKDCSYPGQPALVDLDGDGVLEIVVGGTEHDGGGFVAAVDATGGALRWRYPGSGALAPVGRPVLASVAVARRESGEPLVVAAATDKMLYVLDAAGSLVVKVSTRSFPLSAPAIADFDGDGRDDAALVNDVGRVMVVAVESGAELGFAEIPFDTFFGAIDLVAERKVATAPVAADLDGDGVPELILAHPGFRDEAGALDYELVYAYKLQGGSLAVHWTAPVGDDRLVMAPPAAADVDDDGRVDLVFAANDLSARTLELVVLSGRDGTRLATFVVPDAELCSSAPILADVDQDGTLDAVLGIESGAVAAVSLGVDAGRGDPWPLARRDLANSGHAVLPGSLVATVVKVLAVAMLVVGVLLVAVAGVVWRRGGRSR